MYDSAFWVWFVFHTFTVLSAGYVWGHMRGTTNALKTVRRISVGDCLQEAWPTAPRKRSDKAEVAKTQTRTRFRS